MRKTTLILIFLIIGNSVFSQVFDNILYYQKYTPKQLQKDLNFLLQKFEEIHPNYFKEMPKDTVIKKYTDLKKQIIKPMTRLDFLNLISPVVYNVVKDGHNFYFPLDTDIKLYSDRGGKFFPIPVKIQNGKLFCNSQITFIPYNSEITSINNITSNELINKILNRYYGESQAFEENLYSNWFSNEYYCCYGGFSKYDIEYITTNSKKEVVTHYGFSQKEIDSLRINQTIKKYTFEEIPELKIGVIRYNECDDLVNFRPFCDSIFSIIKEKAYTNLIIDIRSNVGGSTLLNDTLFEYITDKPISQFETIETKISKEKQKDFIRVYKKYFNWFKWYNYLYYPIYIRSNNNMYDIF